MNDNVIVLSDEGEESTRHVGSDSLTDRLISTQSYVEHLSPPPVTTIQALQSSVRSWGIRMCQFLSCRRQPHST